MGIENMGYSVRFENMGHKWLKCSHSWLYLPDNGGHHSLIWEEKADDLGETRKSEIIG